MNLVDFTYVKDNGDQSDRTLLMLYDESRDHLIGGIDVSNMCSDELIKDLKDLHEEQEAELKELLAAHDLKSSYKQFKKANMTNITQEKL